jgi:hypothetical protein
VGYILLELMLTTEELERAGSYVEELRLSVHGLDLPSSNRMRAAGSCFAIAQDHHHAIVLLIQEQLFASSFALLRIEFEAYIRGEWLSQCASDSIVDSFLQGKEPPKVGCLLAELETLESFKEKGLSQIKQQAWKSMCAYTHTGGLHVQRWNTEDGIEANYTRDEVLELLKNAESIASLTVIGVARLASDDELAVRTLEGFKRRVEE